MKKRIILNVFVLPENYDKLKYSLNKIASYSVNISDTEKSHIEMHDCGHDEGKSCAKTEVLL